MLFVAEAFSQPLIHKGKHGYSAMYDDTKLVCVIGVFKFICNLGDSFIYQWVYQDITPL